MHYDIWKYCSKEEEKEFLLSLKLTGNLTAVPQKQYALLYGLANHIESHYTEITIPKKNGGTRTLMIPDNLLKYVQKQILKQVLMQIPVSCYACAYKRGISLKDNALPHQNQKLILKLDIQDFFGSITYISVYQHAFPPELFPPSVRALMTHLCCFRDTLPQGAPASPYISNLVMKPFDEYMGKWCKERGISYTRYCDDMTFSGDFSPQSVIRKTQGFLHRLGFQLNQNKTRIFSQKYRQEVTGIVVNEKIQVSKNYRRKLRQECYYIKKFGIEQHLKQIGYTDKKETYLQQLFGRIEYVLQVNPYDREFLELKLFAKSL